MFVTVLFGGVLLVSGAYLGGRDEVGLFSLTKNTEKSVTKRSVITDNCLTDNRTQEDTKQDQDKAKVNKNSANSVVERSGEKARYSVVGASEVHMAVNSLKEKQFVILPTILTLSGQRS